MRLRDLMNTRTLAVLFLISALISLHYVIGGITAGGDPGFYGIYDWRTFLEKGLYVWQENQIGRSNPLGVALIPFRAFLSAINEAFGLKVAVYVLWLLTIFTGLISVYLFVKYLLVMEGFKGKNVEIASIVAAFAHVFTPIAVAWRIGGNRIGAMPHGMLPLMLLATLVISRQKSLRESIKYLLIFIPIFVFFGGSISNPVVIADFILAAFLLLLVYRKEVNVKGTVISAVLVLLLFSWLIAAIYYAIPSFVTTRQETLKPQGGFPGWAEKYLEDYEAPNALLLYPISFWIGLRAYQGYYTTPAVYVIWSLFIAMILGLSIAKLRHREHKNVLYGIVLYTVSVGLMMAPHLLYEQYLWIIIHIPPLMAFRMTFDKFQYIAQIGLTIMISYFLVIVLSKLNLSDLKSPEKTILERVRASMPFIALLIVIISVFLGAFPAIEGRAMRNPTYEGYNSFKADDHALKEFTSLMEDIISEDPSATFLIVPGLKSYWIQSSWYNGSDYAFYAPGKILASGWLTSQFANEIYSLLSSKDFMFNESKQERLLWLLKLGNVKYIVVRGDVNFSRASGSDLNLYMEYQLPNIMYFIEKYGFRRIAEREDVNFTKAVILPFDNSTAYMRLNKDYSLENFTITLTFRRDLNAWSQAISKGKEDAAKGVIAEIGNITVVDFGNGMVGVLAYNGTRVVPIAARGAYDTGWHTLKIVKKGCELKLFFDNELTMKTTIHGLKLNFLEVSLGAHSKKDLASAFNLGFSFNGHVHNLVVSSGSRRVFDLAEHYQDLILESATISLADPMRPTIFWAIYRSPFNSSIATSLEESLENINASEISPTKYVVHVEGSRSVIISVAYNPRWEVKVEGLAGDLKVLRVENYHGLIKIDIKGNGYGKVILEYVPQRVIRLLCIFSSSIYIALILMLVALRKKL